MFRITDQKFAQIIYRLQNVAALAQCPDRPEKRTIGGPIWISGSLMGLKLGILNARWQDGRDGAGHLILYLKNLVDWTSEPVRPEKLANIRIG